MDPSKDQPAGDAPKYPIRIVSTNTATFSHESRKTIRSHAMTWSRRKRKEAKQKQQSTSRSPTPEYSNSAEQLDTSANKAPVVAASPSHEVCPRTTTPAERRRTSPSSLGQPFIQIPRSHGLQYRHVALDDENFDPGSLRHQSQLFGRTAEHDDDEGFDFNQGLGPTDRISQQQLVPTSRPAWMLPTPPDTPSPATPLDTGHFASFAHTAVPIHYKMAFLLHYFSTVIVQRIDLKSSMVHAYNSLLIPFAVEEPALLYAILLRTSTEFKSGGGDKPDQTVGPYTAMAESSAGSSAPEYLGFKINAVQHLRMRLGSDGGFGSPAMIHAIAILLRAETLNGDLQEIKTHLMGLRQMKAMGHSLSGIPGSISGPHLQSINLACAMTYTAPPFAPTVVGDSKFLTEARKNINDLSDPRLELMGSAFHDPEIANLLGDTLLMYVAGHREFVLFKPLISKRVVIATSEDLELIFDLRHLADYHLLSLPFNEVLSPVQEVVRLTLYISAWLNTLNFDPGLAYTGALLQLLGEALQKLELPSDSTPVSRLLTWVLFVGTHISRTRKERSWFVHHLAKAIKLLGLQSASQLRELLFRYFYMGRVYGQSLQEIWEETRSAAQGLGVKPWYLSPI